MDRVSDIRNQLVNQYNTGDFVIDKTGAKMVELIGATFIADEDWIIRKPNMEYVKHELDWYESQSLNVYDIPGVVPEIWKQIADMYGNINSNYGWCIYSDENSAQFQKCLNELLANKFSRRSTMIYNRPSMHEDYKENGKNDFICTYANQFFIRDNKLVSHYIMRSNDSVFGYCNDYQWAKYVQQHMLSELLLDYPGLELGDIIWTASSLHVYERHFKFIEEYKGTQNGSI
jgi:thymidylate synthase